MAYTDATGPGGYAKPLALPTPKAAPAPAGTTTSPTGGYTFIDPSQANQGGQLIPQSVSKSGAQLYSPSIAATLAGTQYDQAILDAKQNLAMTQAGAAQAMTNVQNWWQSILGSQQQAAQHDQALTTGIEKDAASNNAGILASLGGAANQGAEGVAVAGQNTQGILAALGLNNAQYNNDLAPVLRQSAAGALGQQQNANEVNIAKGMQGVNDQIAAKGNAQAQNEWQILQANNGIRDNRAGRLLQIDQANNQTLDNRSSRLLQIVGANNNTQQAIDQMTETQRNDARNYALQLRQLGDSEKSTKLGVVMSLGYDKKTAGLTPDAQAQIAKMYPGIDPKALTGTSATIVSTILKDNAAAAKVATANGIKAGLIDDTASIHRGYLVGKDGQPKLNKQGQIIPMTGWVADPKSPNGVSQIPAGQPGSILKAPSGSSDRVMQNDVVKNVDSWVKPKATLTSVPYKNQTTGVVGYHSVRVPGKEMSWPDMMSHVNGLSDPKEKAMYLKYMDSQVKEGTNGRPFTTPALANKDAISQATQAMAANTPVDRFISELTNDPAYQTPAGHAAIIKAVETVYHITTDPPTGTHLSDNTGTTIPPSPTGTAGSRGFVGVPSIPAGDNRPSDSTGRMPLIHYNPR